MKLDEYIELFNSIITKGISVEKSIPLILDYLTDIHFNKSREMINLVSSNGTLLIQAVRWIIEYYCRKYCICSIIYNNEIILYYV